MVKRYAELTCNGLEVRIKSLTITELKTETVAVILGGCMVILPTLAKTMPDLYEIGMYKDGLMVGLFAPSNEQSFTAFSRIRERIRSKNAQMIMNDVEIDTYLENDGRGNPMMLSNGSFVRMQTAAKQANIESKSYHVVLIDEAQDCDNTKVKKCLTGDTRVLLADGSYKRLDEIVKDKNDKVIRFKDKFKHLVEDTPLEFYDNGVQEVFKLRLNNGEEIKATANHQFYGFRRGWKKPRWLTVSEIMEYQKTENKIRLAVPDKLPYPKELGDIKDYDKGLIVGHFLGDGCLTGDTPLFIGEEGQVNRLYKSIKAVFGPSMKMSVRKIHENGMYEVGYYTDGNKKGSNPLTSYFKELGIWGLKGEEKHLPNHTSYSVAFYEGFVEGLIETDGCIESYTTKPVISFANISERLVNELRDILLKFGIHSTKFSKDNGEINGYKSKTLHLLHIKSVLDIQRFYDSFILFIKQPMLRMAMETIEGKESKNKSQFYPSTLRFYQVTDIENVGEEQTYCLKMEERNFIANNIVSSNSIHPMLAAYNGTIIKIGTSNTKRSDFYDAIRRNIRNEQRHGARKTHFQFDYKVVSKYNPKYKTFVEKEIKRLGYDSDEFRMAYRLHFILERGMFITQDELEEKVYDPKLKHTDSEMEYDCVVGIDVAKGGDSTVVTVLRVDYDNMVVNEDTGEEYPTKELVNWLEFNGENHEAQFHQITDWLSQFRVSCIYIDSTGMGDPVADRFKAYYSGQAQVEGYKFTRPSKSVMWKFLYQEINAGRLKVPAHPRTQRLRAWKKFNSQMLDLEKDYVGQYMVCQHPNEKGAHDDFCDSLGLACLASQAEALPEVQVSDNFLYPTRNDVDRRLFGNWR